MGPLAKRFLDRAIKRGTLIFETVDGQRSVFGDGTGEPYVIKFHDDKVAVDIFKNPHLRFAELYMDGRWSLVEGDLTKLFIFLFNEQRKNGLVAGWRGIFQHVMRRVHQRNNARMARQNASHHYDVGNDIYALFLDEDWQYSCAYFADSDASLEEAQLAKKRHIASKLMLEDDHRVLDIGCGWGGMGLYLADNTGADVTGITLSDEQASRANARAAGRPDVRFKIEDYRAVNETFDRLVSVGMFEHVGVGYFDEYFAACRRLMKDDGVMLLHSIGRTGPPGYTAPFI
ncbi:MAG: cyclopropane-fatty-acyl-phospholipid synthase family protein, partial [Pseudomonadota bacterium]